MIGTVYLESGRKERGQNRHLYRCFYSPLDIRNKQTFLNRSKKKEGTFNQKENPVKFIKYKTIF